MKKLKTTMLFVCLLTFINSLHAQPDSDIFDLQSQTYQDEVPSGTNDYTDAIQAAIDAAAANGGGIILFPGNKTVEITRQFDIGNNITLKASYATATIKCSDDFSDTRMFHISSSNNVVFENIRFDANEKAQLIIGNYTSSSNIDVMNCVFENAKLQYGAGIYLLNVTNLNVKNCIFLESFLGISISGRSTKIYIENNTFEETLDNSPIRISGTQLGNNFSNHVWIRGNDMRIGRSVSIIDELDGILDRDDIDGNNTGAVSGLNQVNGLPERTDDQGNTLPPDANYNETYYTWRNGIAKGHYAIDISCGGNPQGSNTNYHENIVVENNIAIGPDYGFFDGGSGDLYALKDIVRLKCVNNVARNSGDLGFAIVNCTSAIVSGNTADRNNSFGIAIDNTRNSVITGNILENNALRRDYLYNSTPYGGLLIAGGKSYNNILEGNHFFGFTDIAPSSQNNYNIRRTPTDYYGIVIRKNYNDTAGLNYTGVPFLNKIGDNHYAGQKWGPIYNQVVYTQLNDDFSAFTFPTNRDYPLGTWIRNSNLNNSALGWSVINRVETRLYADWGTNHTVMKVIDKSNTIQKNDIFGIMLNDGSIHWSEIQELTFVPGPTQDDDHYEVKLVQFPAASVDEGGDPLNPIIDPATAINDYNMDRIVILRWLTVTK